MGLSVPVVEVVPDWQGGTALIRVLVSAAVGPFAQRRLDEAFGLAVGLRPVGAGELLSDAQLEAVSFGKERPAVQGSDEAAWAKNRRAELKDR